MFHMFHIGQKLPCQQQLYKMLTTSSRCVMECFYIHNLFDDAYNCVLHDKGKNTPLGIIIGILSQ